MHPCYKALHGQRPALEGENPPLNPSLGTGGPTPTLCSWEVSLIEGCQLGDAQRQSRGSRHPVESRRTPASLVSLTHSKGFMALRCFFPAASPVLLLALPPPAPSSTFFALPVGFSSPRRRGLHGTQSSQSHTRRLPAELHGRAGGTACPRKDLCRQHGASPQLTCLRDIPEPLSPCPIIPLPGERQKCPFHVPMLRHSSLC